MGKLLEANGHISKTEKGSTDPTRQSLKEVTIEMKIGTSVLRDIIGKRRPVPALSFEVPRLWL